MNNSYFAVPGKRIFFSETDVKLVSNMANPVKSISLDYLIFVQIPPMQTQKANDSIINTNLIKIRRLKSKVLFSYVPYFSQMSISIFLYMSHQYI